jgi:hypothetical protein
MNNLIGLLLLTSFALSLGYGLGSGHAGKDWNEGGACGTAMLILTMAASAVIAITVWFISHLRWVP